MQAMSLPSHENLSLAQQVMRCSATQVQGGILRRLRDNLTYESVESERPTAPQAVGVVARREPHAPNADAAGGLTLTLTRNSRANARTIRPVRVLVIAAGVRVAAHLPAILFIIQRVSQLYLVYASAPATGFR